MGGEREKCQGRPPGFGPSDKVPVVKLLGGMEGAVGYVATWRSQLNTQAGCPSLEPRAEAMVERVSVW